MYAGPIAKNRPTLRSGALCATREVANPWPVSPYPWKAHLSIPLLTERAGLDFKTLKPGDYTLKVSTVGYKLALTNFNLPAGEIKEFEVTLTPDNLRQTTTVEVNAGPFGAPRIDSPSEISLSGNDAKNLASVLADDPLRAVQALPGITSDDDFNSRFSLRAADYSRIGLYLDDVLLHQPFHMIEGESGTGSLTIVNGDMLDNIDVQSGVYPAAYGDSTAAAVDIQTREGSQVKPSFRCDCQRLQFRGAGRRALGQGARGGLDLQRAQKLPAIHRR